MLDFYVQHKAGGKEVRRHYIVGLSRRRFCEHSISGTLRFGINSTCSLFPQLILICVENKSYESIFVVYETRLVSACQLSLHNIMLLRTRICRKGSGMNFFLALEAVKHLCSVQQMFYRSSFYSARLGMTRRLQPIFYSTLVNFTDIADLT